MLGQKKCSFISSKVRSYPKYPMTTCNSLNTNGFILVISLGCFHHLFCKVSYHYSVPGWGVPAKASWTGMILLQHRQLSYFSEILSHLWFFVSNVLDLEPPNIISSKWTYSSITFFVQHFSMNIIVVLNTLTVGIHDSLLFYWLTAASKIDLISSALHNSLYSLMQLSLWMGNLLKVSATWFWALGL